MTTRTFTFTVTAPSTGTPAWLTGKPLNQWFEISGTALSSCPPSQGAQYGSPAAKINTWNGATLRPTDSVYLIGAAGGHGDYGGNEVNALRLNVDSPAWVELRPSTLLADMVDGAAVYLDLRRSSVHTYNMLQFVPQDDRLVVMPYAGMGESALPDASPAWQALYVANRIPGSFKAVNWFAYNAGNDWDIAELAASTSTPRRGFYPTMPTNNSTWGMVGCCDSVTGDLYRGDAAFGLWRMNRATDSWSLVSSGFAQSWAGNAICVDPVVRNGESYRRLMMVSHGGESGREGAYRLDTAAKLTVGLESGSEPWSVLTQGTYNCLQYDAHNDCFWAFLNGPDGNFAQYKIQYVTPTTYRITKIPVLATSGSTVPNFTNRNGIHNAVQYVPELKGFVVADQYDGNVHFMRVG